MRSGEGEENRFAATDWETAAEVGAVLSAGLEQPELARECAAVVSRGSFAENRTLNRALSTLVDTTDFSAVSVQTLVTQGEGPLSSPEARCPP